MVTIGKSFDFGSFLSKALSLFFRLGICLGLYALPDHAMAQSAGPELYDIVRPVINFYNPAAETTNRHATFTTGGRSYVSSAQLFRHFYVGAAVKVNRGKTESKVGLIATNTREGDLFQHSSVEGLYAYRVQLTSDWTMGGGVSAGFKNYYVRSTGISPGGSDFALQGNVGIVASSEKWKFGAAYNRFTGGALQPLDTRIALEPYWTVMMATHQTLVPNLKLRPGVIVLHGIRPDVVVNTYCWFDIHQHIHLGGTYWHKQSVGVIGGIDLPVPGESDHMLSFHCSYNFPLGIVYQTLNAFELNVGYCFD